MPPTSRKPRTLLWAGLTILWFCLFPIGIVWFSLTAGARYGAESLRRSIDSECRERLGRVYRGLAMYAEQADGALPPGDRWVDASWRYAARKDPKDESESVYRCPSVSARRTGEYGYALNRDAAGALLAGLGEDIPLVFDASGLGRNATSWTESAANPPRHAKGSKNYGVFSDGTVRPLSALPSERR